MHSPSLSKFPIVAQYHDETQHSPEAAGLLFVSPVFQLSEAAGQPASTLGMATLYRALITEELAEMDEAANRAEELDGGLDLIWVVIGFLRARGYTEKQIALGWAEVARSNLAKIDPVSGTVLKREDGKVLKPAGWTPPNLHAILEG